MSGPNFVELERRAERRRERREQVRLRRLVASGSVAVIIVAAVVLATGAFASSAGLKVVQVVLTNPLPAQLPVQVTIKVPARQAPSGGASAGSSPVVSAPRKRTSTPRANGGALLKPGAAASFAALQRGLAGPVGVAVAGVQGGGEFVLGDDEPAHGWSTTKVPVLVGLLKATHGALSATERQEAQLAITESDNQSIIDLFDDLEQLEGGLDGASSYVTSLFRESGDDSTIVATAPPPPGAVTTFGQTEWPPSEAVKFYRALAAGCLLPAAQTDYVLGLMEHIVSYESWGLGSAGFHSVAFKGGWGPESGGYLVRQSGIVAPSTPDAVAVAIVAHPPEGADSFTVGTQMVTETAQWLARELVLAPRSGAGCPS
jgi:hypothetical protein